LTNLAIALNVEPDLPAMLRRVIVMGGAFTVPGNVTPAAEFNVFADPEAASQVFAAPFPHVIAVGLDVTQRTTLPRSIWEAAERTPPDDPAARLVGRICRRAFLDRGLERVYLHDPLAVAVALDPTLVTTEAVRVDVQLHNGQEGRTRTGGAGPVRVAREVDAGRFLDRFVDALSLPRPEELR